MNVEDRLEGHAVHTAYRAEEDILRWFGSPHFARLAQHIVNVCKPGTERAIALRKLLESQDATTRAILHPSY